MSARAMLPGAMPAQLAHRSGAGGLLSGAALLLASSSASAAGLSRYEAPAGCPAREQLALPADDAAGPPSLELLVRAQAQGFRATVVIHDGPGPPSSRELVGESCDEVVAAARLIALLVLALPLDDAPAAPSTPPPSPPPPTAPAAGPGLALEGRGGVGPSIRPALGAYFRLPGPAHSDLWLGLSTAWSSTIKRQGQASLALLTGRFVGCTAGITPLPALALRPCARVEPGVLSGVGAQVEQASRATRLHLAAGAVGRLEIAPLRSIRVSFEVGALGLASRPRFYFGPDATVYRPPAVVGVAGVDAAMLFW